MGIIDYDLLDPQTHESDLDAAFADAQKIGGLARTFETSVMQVVRQDGTLTFGGEVPVVAMNRFRFVRTHDGRECSWMRLELKAPRGGEIARQDRATFTEHPWSGAWYASAPFKGTNRKSKDEREGDRP